MKIYTGTGDHGRTSLFSGERVSKADQRVLICGEMDELGAHMGVVVAHARLLPDLQEVLDELDWMQRLLFVMGALVATPEDAPQFELLDQLQQTDVQRVTDAIDRLEKALPKLASFVVPGGTLPAAEAHVVRTVCRRLERSLIGWFAEQYPQTLPPHLQVIQVFVNRLSDYFFMLARFLNHVQGETESAWKP